MKISPSQSLNTSTFCADEGSPCAGHGCWNAQITAVPGVIATGRLVLGLAVVAS